MKIELEDSDIERIAKAVAKELGGKAPAASSDKPASGKGKGADGKASTAKPPEEKPEDNAEAILKRRAEVLAKVKLVGEKIGRDEAKALINQYAPSMGEVKPGDFDALEAELDAKLNAPAKDAEDDY